jgi:type I restriction enzyme S subunit
MNPSEWIVETVESCLDETLIPSTPKIQAGDYQAAGRYPVVDQGQALIAGWTDDEVALIDSSLPLILFGDHTRILKFLDFPFARGADGTQLLKPKPGINPLFFYYALRAIDLPSRGYNRHFTLLKEQTIARPEIEEQELIAQVLATTEATHKLQLDQIRAIEQLKSGTMHHLFTRGLCNNDQKETDIGFVPKDWRIKKIGDCFSVVSGGTPSRRKAVYWEGGTIPWVKTTEIDYGVITKTEEGITAFGLANSAAKLLRAGTVLMAMYGQGTTRGKVAILGITAACNQACAALNPLSEEVDPWFLFYFLANRYYEIRRLAHGGQQQNLNLDIVRDLEIAFPSDTAEQKSIVKILKAIDRKIQAQRGKAEVLKRTFQALLNKAMIDETPLSNLDIGAPPRVGAQ